MAADFRGAELPFELSLIRIDFALADGDGKLAHRLLSESRAHDQSVNVRRSSWTRAFELRLRQLGFGKRLSNVEVDEIVERSRRQNPMIGLRDAEIAVAVFHWAKSDQARARQIAEEYLLRNRLTRAPASPLLRDALSMANSDEFIDGWRIRASPAERSKRA
jgi:hypothetical protein